MNLDRGFRQRRYLSFGMIFAIAAGYLSTVSTGQTSPLSDTVAQSMRDELRSGKVLLPVWWDAKSGKLFLAIPLTEAAGAESPEYILSDSLTYAVGENDLSLDRGQMGIQLDDILTTPESPARLVLFKRIGSKILLIQENTKFRSSSGDKLEQLAVEQSFPSSVLSAFNIEKEIDNGAIVDATKYFEEDIQSVSEVLSVEKQGSYKVDPDRSIIVPEDSKAFPENTEIEAELTFGTDDPSQAKILANVAPEVRAVTVHERHTFLRMPGPGYVPRLFSPRAGYFDLTWRATNAPLGIDFDQQFIKRFRLQKADPSCTHDCKALHPIHYYVDRGAPEPIRGALLEGCRWWDQAFRDAGWAEGTFQVDLLPEGVDPMDVRYNMIQWVNRFNRGLSYGEVIVDPRTGEILKGNVTLGSLRGQQDYLLAESLLAPYEDGKVPDPQHDRALAMVLDRIRQLAAHETGHTLGLRHNFAASSIPHPPDKSISVMDYPFPWITLDQSGVPDLSHSYPAGIGDWDKVAINFGYREFDRDGRPIEDSDAMNHILHSAESKGLFFLTDGDARPKGSASPIAHLWDNGSAAESELNRLLDVRQAALQRFGENAIRTGVPLAQLEDTLVPLYLLHRYQTEATTKLIGGLDYRYNVRGDGQKGPEIVSADRQRAAIAAVVKTLSPSVLTLPESLLRRLPPRTPGMRRTVDDTTTIETFVSHTSVTFDPIAVAESAADMTLTVLFEPERANRLVEYHARDASEPTIEDVIDAALNSTDVAASNGLERLVAANVKARVFEALFRLGSDPQISFAARSEITAKLHAIAKSLPADPGGQELRRRVAAFEQDPEKFQPLPVVPAPPGSPIGDDELIQ